jgi:hypothetical protein
VTGRSRATATQSAAVSGSIDKARRDPSARRSSAAATPGSFPASASLDRTSAQLTTLTAAPSPIASMTTDAPSSAWRTAIRAEASRTDAGLLSATAASANRRLATLSGCLRPTVCDQLVDQAAIWRHVSKQASHPLRCGATSFDLGFGELGHMGHARNVSTDQDLTTIATRLGYPSPSAGWNAPYSASKTAISSSVASRSPLASIACQEISSMFRGSCIRQTTWQTQRRDHYPDFMAHHKRKRPKHRRSGCLRCKPHKLTANVKAERRKNCRAALAHERSAT